MGQLLLIYQLMKFEEIFKVFEDFLWYFAKRKSVTFPDKMFIIQYYDYE